jgi:hypothetical protein
MRRIKVEGRIRLKQRRKKECIPKNAKTKITK